MKLVPMVKTVLLAKLVLVASQGRGDALVAQAQLVLAEVMEVQVQAVQLDPSALLVLQGFQVPPA